MADHFEMRAAVRRAQGNHDNIVELVRMWKSTLHAKFPSDHSLADLLIDLHAIETELIAMRATIENLEAEIVRLGRLATY